MEAKWGALRRLRRVWIDLAPLVFARCCAPDDAELGLLGERIAERRLRAAGWTILARRQRTADLEVDLVAREAGRLVLVEVKSKRVQPIPRPAGSRVSASAMAVAHAARWRPGRRFSRERIARLAALARRLERAGEPAPRIDLVEVFVGPRGGPIHLEHHRGLDRPLDE